MDMMDNLSIFYDREIIVEMQIICCIIVIGFHDLFELNNVHDASENVDYSMKVKFVVIYLLLHLLSYF